MAIRQARGTELLRNISRSARQPGRFVEMCRKTYHRLTARLRHEDRAASRRWAESQAVDVEALLRAVDPAQWDEAVAFMARFGPEASAVLASLGVKLGGGGDYRLLHFLVRHLRPAVVVETGVAAGFSSAAILQAMEANGCGHLWSSDFPYFRLDHPEQYIGVLVPPDERERWTLLTTGDRTSLPQIVAECGPIDLFHYDSDKSVEGRAFAAKLVVPRMASDGVIVFDDVQDNFHFRDFLQSSGLQGNVFEFGGKFVGMVALGGPLASLAA